MSLRALTLLLLALAVSSAQAAPWTPTGAPKKVRRAKAADRETIKEVDVLVIGAGSLPASRPRRKCRRPVARSRCSRPPIAASAAARTPTRTVTTSARRGTTTRSTTASRPRSIVRSARRWSTRRSTAARSWQKNRGLRARAARRKAQTERFSRDEGTRRGDGASPNLRDGKDVSAGAISRLGGKWAQLIADELPASSTRA